MTLSRAEVMRLVRQHSLVPSRALGQNFVVDPNTVRRVARTAEVGPGDRVVEVGAGLGSLTLALAETGAEVLALEKDRRLVPVLQQVLSERLAPAPRAEPPGPPAPSAPPSAARSAAPPTGRARVVQADAMALDWATFLAPPPGWVLVSNLPYNIATPLVANLLDRVPAIERLVVVVQEEVARRLVARPGDPAYGAVSVKVAYWAEARWCGPVPRSVFLPRPRVGSALVSLRRRPQPAVDPAVAPPELLFEVVRAGYATRRKMLRRALEGTVPPAAFEVAGVDPRWRAEQLSIDDWGRLAGALARSGRRRAAR